MQGSVSVAAVVRPGGRVLQVLDYTFPADGTKPQPTGRTWLSMTYRGQTLNRSCERDPVLKRPQTADFYGPYPPSNVGKIWCLKRAVAEARLTRTGGGVWFAPNGACPPQYA